MGQRSTREYCGQLPPLIESFRQLSTLRGSHEACSWIGTPISAVLTPITALGSGPSGTTTALAGTASPTEKVAGPQHSCSTNGITCAEQLQNWDEFPDPAAPVGSVTKRLNDFRSVTVANSCRSGS
jgi:hypothetical protein